MDYSKQRQIYLSPDHLRLTDENGNTIAIKQEVDGQSFFRPLSIESEAYEKKCRKTTSIKVCTRWDSDNNCLAYGTAEVCSQWEYLPYGFSNIS